MTELISESQGLRETLRILMGLPRVLEAAMEDPSWSGLNRWWFLTYNFPLGMITQEALQSLREQQMFQWKIRLGKGGARVLNRVGLCSKCQALDLDLTLARDHLVTTTLMSSLKQVSMLYLPLKAWRKNILSTTKKISHLLKTCFCLCERRGHRWIKPASVVVLLFL